MELQFQKQNPYNVVDGSRISSSSNNKRKFVGVRQRPSGKWVAEIKNTTQKIRMWLGTFDTAEEAAQAYDEAACLLRGSNTRTNFMSHAPCNPALSMKIRNLLNQKKSRLNKIKTAAAATQNGIRGSSSLRSTISPTTSSSSSLRSIISPTASSSSSTSNYNCSSDDNNSTAVFATIQAETKLFDDAYKPDLSYFMAAAGGYDHHQMGLSCSYQFESDFDRILLGQQQGVAGFEMGKKDVISEMMMSADHRQIPQHHQNQINADFEHMKVERQISASLYAMNGVSEYWENVHDCNDSFWDLPMVYQMFCPS